MRAGLFVFIFVAACGGSSTETGDCRQWKDADTCNAHAGCFANACPDCDGNAPFIGCNGPGMPGAACPALWLRGCCQRLSNDAACEALGGCYPVYDSTSQFAACYGGHPICTTTQDCTNGISCPTGYSPTSTSNAPSANPTTDGGTVCSCVQSSQCAPDLS